MANLRTLTNIRLADFLEFGQDETEETFDPSIFDAIDHPPASIDEPLAYLCDLLEDEEITEAELRLQAHSAGYCDAEIDAALN